MQQALLNNTKQNNVIQRNINGLIISIITMLCCIICVFTILFSKNLSRTYESIVFLPIAYAFIGLLFSRVFEYMTKSIVVFFLLGGYFIRMVLTPTLFALGGYQSLFYVGITARNVNLATILLVYEFIVVCITINYFISKWELLVQPKKIQMENYKTTLLFLGVFLVVLFMVYVYISVPQLSTIYLFVFNTSLDAIANIQWDNETIVARGTMQRYLYSLFTYLWPIIRVILPALFISQIYKKYGEKRVSVFLSILCTMIPFLLLSGDNIAPFTGLVLCLIVMHKLYGKKGNLAISAIIALGGIAILIVIMSKLASLSSWRGARGIASIAQFLNAYFPGFDNIAITLGIENSDKLKTLFYDLYYTIPFKETLFGLSGKNLSNLFGESSATGAQIVPWCAQIAHYTTILFSPVITSIFVILALKAEDKSRQTDNFWVYYALIYFAFFTAISISIYSFSIYLRNLINVLLPMVIAISLVRRKKRQTA